MQETPENITKLNQNEIFVFGSNESGIHGAGAAYVAMKEFGAKYGNGWGHYGSSFAIPTKDWGVDTLTIPEIQFYVDRFYAYTKLQPYLFFYVTAIGCGLAGYNPSDIAPLFADFKNSENVALPKSFFTHLNL